MAQALHAAAAWVDCDEVSLGVVEPAEYAGRLRSALAAV
jgi:hypothetical protein